MPFNAGDLKWGEPILGTPSGTITWSADYFDTLDYVNSFSELDFDAALVAAFDTWESVASIDFQMVASADLSDVDLLSGPIGGAAGIAQYSYDSNPGLSSILGGSVTFSSDLTWSPYGGSGGVDFYAVALHEIGHILGLGHVNDPTEIMNPVISTDTLGSGDIAGAQYLYGRDSGDAAPPAGEDGPGDDSTGLTSADGGGGGGGGAVLLLGLLAALLGMIFGGGAAAGMAIAAGRVAGTEDEDRHGPEDDHGHDTDEPGVTEQVHVSFVAEMPLPGIPVEDSASPCGCYRPCDCLTEQAFAAEFLV